MDEKLKSVFLSLYCMVMADGIVSAKELEALYRIGRENYQISPEEINKSITSAGNSFVIPENIEGRVNILFEMAEIAWADGDIDSTEIQLLNRYAIRMGFLEENAAKISTFLIEEKRKGTSIKEVIALINS